MTGFLMRRETSGYKETDVEARAHVTGHVKQGFGDEAKGQGPPMIGGHSQNQEKVRVDSSLQPSEGAWPANILILGF